MSAEAFLKPFSKLDRDVLDEMMAEARSLVEEDAALMQELSGRARMAHAPPGGVTIGGKFFKGGQFIPKEVLEEATEEERRAVEEGEQKEPKESAGPGPETREVSPMLAKPGPFGETVNFIKLTVERDDPDRFWIDHSRRLEDGGWTSLGRKSRPIGKLKDFVSAMKADGFSELDPLEKLPQNFTPVNSKGKFTWDRFQDDQGKGVEWLGKENEEGRFYWSEERQQLHKAIVDQFFEKATPVENPVFHLMGGGPASGKSAVLESGAIDLPENQVSVDSDGIKGMLPEYRRMLQEKDKTAAAFAHEESSYLAKQVMARALSEGFNTNLDGTGDGSMKSLKKKIDKARAAGMPVKASYMTIETDLSWKIAQLRFEKTGRYVPETIVRNTHRSVSQILPAALEEDLFDDVTLWDNNVKDEPRLVMTKKRGEPVQIHDQGLWDQFVAKGA